jgi:hypothetical protein
LGKIDIQQGECCLAAATILISLLACAGRSVKAWIKRLRSSERKALQ